MEQHYAANNSWATKEIALLIWENDKAYSKPYD